MLKELIKICVIILLVLSCSKSYSNEETNVLSSEEKVLDPKVFSTSNSITWPRIPENLDALCSWMKTNIKYQDDEKRWGTQYWQTPEETLYYRTGDCEDFAGLFTAILQKWGYDAKILNFMWIEKKSKWVNGHSMCLFIFNRRMYLVDNKCKLYPIPTYIRSYDEIVTCIEKEWRIYEVYENKDNRIFRRVKGINGIIKGN